MRGSWRPLAVAVAVNMTVGAGVVTAQSVVVRHAPPDAPIEVVLDAAPVASATADASGNATLAFDLSATLHKAQADVRAYLDVCEKVRRVLIVESSQQPAPPEPGCARSQVMQLFLLRPVTTLFVDLAGANPIVRLRQGPVPRQWLTQDLQGGGPVRVWRPLPKGLVLFGGAGMGKFGNEVSLSCGTVSSCSGRSTRPTYSVGADFWFTRFLAAEVSYVSPSAVTTTGSGDTYRFDSSLEARFLTVAGKIGVHAGPARIYGKVGMDYHRATSTTTETIDDTTITVDGVDQTIQGGTQSYGFQTKGWSWAFGGGAEIWVIPRLAIYGEAGQAALKGTATDGSESFLNERVTWVVAGARVHIGG